MTTYYVQANHKISTSIFNPPAGWILAEFPASEPSTPFNPMNLLTDGYLDKVKTNNDEAKAKAEEFLENLIKSGHKPIDIRDTPEYKNA